MSNEEIKTLVEQEAEKQARQLHSPMGKEYLPSIGGFIAGTRFYEQSILPEVLKEKEHKAFDAGFLEARIHLRDPTLTEQEEYGKP